MVLVQFGDVYCVKDGHHRISAARVLGESRIKVRVMVWQVAGALPWDRPSKESGVGLFARLLGSGRALGKLLPEGARVSTFGLG